jgi:hypothetical protein
MKFDIAWHKECLKNMRASHERERAELERRQYAINRNFDQIMFYELQIASAEREHKDGFDQDKYKKARRNTSEGVVLQPATV